MCSIRRIALALLLALLVVSADVVPASAHTISEAQAYGVADPIGEGAYAGTSWADNWGDECNRQTPWRFSCFIEVWSEAEGGGDCWRYFDITSPILGSRLRVQNRTPWTCDPQP